MLAGAACSSSSTTPAGIESPEASSSDGAPAIEPAGDPAVHWVGRFDTSEPGIRRMGWSGAGFVVRFDGTGASVRMDDAARYFTVVIDGEVQAPLATTPGLRDYVLARGLPAGHHVVELYRRTEGHFGPTEIHEVMLEGTLAAPPIETRRIEIVGDSISAGYGNEGVSPCSFSAETENHYLTYGAMAARAVGAEVQTVAWSGKGAIYNYGDDRLQPLPELYDRTIATETDPWRFDWQPDVVVINLGTNDFSTDDDPSQTQFSEAYLALLVHLREVYPSAMMLVVAPSLFGAEASLVQGYLGDVVARRRAAGDARVAFADINVAWLGSGCDGHPDVATHEAMAARLVDALQQHLGW
ncbi:MAG: SGNH/GDSL hydrolase family protein [Myxococcota bacterium]